MSKRNIIYPFAVFLALLLLTGCTKEDMSDCGIEVGFKYTQNVDQTYELPPDFTKVSLFVFDSEGVFVGEYKDEGTHINTSYRMKIILDDGVYDLIAFGDSDDEEDDYAYTQLVPGVTKISDIKLYLKTTEFGEVTKHPENLYYGIIERIKVTPGGGAQRLSINMIKDTNFIRVTAKGLPLGTRMAPNTQFSCRITDCNSEYTFGNFLTGNKQIVYIPQYKIINTDMVSEFTVMRLLSTGDTRIVFQQHPLDSSLATNLFNKRLAELLPPNTDLNREHSFDILITFDLNTTGGAITVVVNGWTTVINGGIIG